MFVCVCVCLCVSGGDAGHEQEAVDHRLPAQEVRAKQETPGDHQQEAAGLCTGNTCIKWAQNLFHLALKGQKVRVFTVLIVTSR